ncbi:uncharacterized protein OCT59_015022 [Rhizophagus irregularis]|uniref:uncharacterized protein n=1 Tax=Rhizophagus irregularis TaxID=588596 RepID=UPI0033271F4E|nr:hypothetical protein OCT59_015022 [Rhizophagus irregularis]
MSKKNSTYDWSYFHNKILDQYFNLYRECSSENFDYYGITDETSCGNYICPLCKLGHNDEEIEGRKMTESVKILTANYLNWHAKLTGLPSILTDKIHSNLYKKYKREIGLEPWQLSEVHKSEVIIHQKTKYPIYLFPPPFLRNNYNFASPQPWSSPCSICNGKHRNYGLHGSWYCENGNQFPYNPELAKFYSQDKLEYCLTCNTSSKKLKFAIVS